MQRRTFVRATSIAAVGAVGSLAGCTSPGGEEGGSEDSGGEAEEEDAGEEEEDEGGQEEGGEEEEEPLMGTNRGQSFETTH